MPSLFDDGDVLVAPLYAVALLLIATPVFDFVTSVLPLRLGNIEWRFAAVGLLSGFLLTPLLGILVATLAALIARHRLFLTVLAWSSLILATGLALLVVAFALDILQLRSVVTADAAPQFQSAAIKAVVKHVSFLIVLSWLAWKIQRLARGMRRPASARKGGSIMMGDPQ